LENKGEKMKENRIIITTMLLNFTVFVLKLICGIVFSFSTLIADSIQSCVDFITDIMSLIANKIGKRRANKNYPFGYGQVYYLANLFTGFLLFLIGIFILYQFFFFKGELKPKLVLFIMLAIILMLKLVVVHLLQRYGKKFKSELLIEASKESRADFISTCVVLWVLILELFKPYFSVNIDVDKIGSLGMAIYVFYTSIKMIVLNVRGILTNDEENTEIKEKVEKELSEFKQMQLKNVRVIKMSTYYTVFVQVKLEDNLTIREYLEMERKLKAHLKSKNRLLRFIDVEPV